MTLLFVLGIAGLIFWGQNSYAKVCEDLFRIEPTTLPKHFISAIEAHQLGLFRGLTSPKIPGMIVVTRDLRTLLSQKPVADEIDVVTVYISMEVDALPERTFTHLMNLNYNIYARVGSGSEEVTAQTLVPAKLIGSRTEILRFLNGEFATRSVSSARTSTDLARYYLAKAAREQAIQNLRAALGENLTERQALFVYSLRSFESEIVAMSLDASGRLTLNVKTGSVGRFKKALEGYSRIRIRIVDAGQNSPVAL